MRIKLICLLVLFTTQAQAETDTPSSLQKVIVKGSSGDVEAGRDAVAGKIITSVSGSTSRARQPWA